MRMMMPSSTTKPIASAQVIFVAMEKATKALRPRPVARASGKLAKTPMKIVIRPATRAVPAAMADRLDPSPRPAAEELPVGVLDEAEDERVEDDDVGHREERDDAAADLAFDAGAAFGDLEEAVDAARRDWGALGRCFRHGAKASGA
jgi:hypothetical protein